MIGVKEEFIQKMGWGIANATIRCFLYIESTLITSPLILQLYMWKR